MKKYSGILRTRLNKPSITDEHIIRERLINSIENNFTKPLTLICAPAGYGKSVLMSSCIDKCRKPYAWISLGEEDNDLRGFLEYLTTALNKVFPGKLDKMDSLLSASELPTVMVISQILTNCLDEIEDEYYLVLDDYHLIKDNSIHNLVNIILKFPPENMHLAILSRSDPPLSMSSLRAYERINEIRIADLMFTKPETSTLYKTLLGPKLDDKLIDKLLKKTEGWVVGLILTIHIIKSSKDLKSILEKVSGGSYMISEYLISEVLDRQKVEMQNLLLKTSVLDKFCSDLLDSLNETDLLPGSDKIDGQEFIDSLKRSNLFIISLDDENRWFRYHHLFRETIKNELKKQKTEAEISQIHEHVSKWFERNNYIQQSIYHEIAGGNIIEAGNIISRHRVAEFDNDNWYVVQRWIHMIPKNIRHKSPHLLLSEAWCAYENFQLEKIPPYLDHIKSLLNDNDDNQTLWGEWYLFNGLISYWFGNAEIALPHLQKAIKLLSETQMLFMGMAHLHIGLARAVTGQNELAIKELNNLLSNGKEDILYNTRLVAGLFYINYFAGNIKFSRREAQRLQNISERHNLYYTNAMGVCMEAISCFNSYALQDALHLFEIAEQNRYILHKGTALDAIAGKIITHQLLQQPNEANKSLGLLESFEKEIDSSALLSISKSCNARLALLRGDLKSALSWETTLNEKLTYAGLFVWIEIPMLTQVRVLISKGTAESLVRAEYLLKEFILKSRHFHLTNQIIEALGLKSMLYEKQGDSKEALKILNEVLELSAPKLWIRPFIELGNPMAELLKKITEHSKFSEFINVILRFFDLRKEVIHSSADTSDPGKEADSITEREIEILNLIAQGFRNNEIADKLFLSAKTIKGYNYKIYKKLNVNSRIQAIERAKILKIIK